VSFNELVRPASSPAACPSIPWLARRDKDLREIFTLVQWPLSASVYASLEPTAGTRDMG
jgi:hypothetical protein